MLQNGVSHRCECVKLSARGRLAPFWAAANLPDKVLRDMGYRIDSIAISHDMRPLSQQLSTSTNHILTFCLELRLLLKLACPESILRLSHLSLEFRTCWSATEKKTTQTPKYTKNTTPTSEFPLHQDIEEIPQEKVLRVQKILKFSETFSPLTCCPDCCGIDFFASDHFREFHMNSLVYLR